jgi:hypothetical protein
MPDGLPIIAAYIDTDTTGGAVITLSDELSDAPAAALHGGLMP